jgi:hydroxyacylglutathione hydrolase
MLDYDEAFALIVREEEKEEVTRKLMRIGLDNIVGYITPEEMKVIFKDELESYSPISYDALKQKMNTEKIQVVDVRGSSEYKENHIPGSKNVFVGTLANNLDQIPKNKKVVIHCQSGDRAATAYSILRKAGYDNVLNYSGGMKEWLEKEEAVPA